MGAMGVTIPFIREMSFVYGEVQQVSPLVRRVGARHPSLFTLHGTNTYIVGRGRVMVIGPGPALNLATSVAPVVWMISPAARHVEFFTREPAAAKCAQHRFDLPA